VAFYGSPACSAACRAGAYFSVTVRMDPKVRAAIAAIPEQAWTPIRYPALPGMTQLGRWISDAQVAEVKYTAFTSKKGQAMTARLIVRRVKDLSKKTAIGQGDCSPPGATTPCLPTPRTRCSRQKSTTAATPRPSKSSPTGPAARSPTCHRARSPPMPPWLALAAISCKLRAAGCLASLAHAKAKGATVRRDLIAVAARTARHGRGHLTLHPPEGWHREHEWMNLFEALRPATRYGLTSPDPVTASRRPAAASPAAKRTTRTSRRKVSGQTTCAGQPGRSRPPAYIRPQRAPHSGGGSRLSHSPPLALRGPPHLLHRQCDGRNSSGPPARQNLPLISNAPV